MASVHHGEHILTTAHLVTWLKTYQLEWLAEYMSSKPTDERTYKSLVQWCLRTKMPLLLIVKGRPGGDIATKEVPTYPAGPVYAVQKTAYMNQRVWNMYLREVLKPELDCPSVLLTDNLKYHLSKKSYKIMQDELYSGAFLQPLSANTTSVQQPLDVGVMGPFKQMCHTEWIKEGKVVTATAKRLVMIKRAIKVWDGMKEDTVRKSFEQALHTYEI
ncbi:hypothetical protein B5M09_009991 [Aphanomyces astaci]|uniref:DDE-1 domain-containing protein n=1 Tax=Aphanomyces astaci TaxID=112090 RepID=A0A3R7ZND5_APHAT|nr:hypothetical protein B5M09_009991 [Aphanomyces astaci]